jgi:hypothetical protein
VLTRCNYAGRSFPQIFLVWLSFNFVSSVGINLSTTVSGDSLFVAPIGSRIG